MVCKQKKYQIDTSICTWKVGNLKDIYVCIIIFFNTNNNNNNNNNNNDNNIIIIIIMIRDVNKN